MLIDLQYSTSLYQYIPAKQLPVQNNYLVVVSLLLTLNILHTFFCFYCWLWASKCLLGCSKAMQGLYNIFLKNWKLIWKISELKFCLLGLVLKVLNPWKYWNTSLQMRYHFKSSLQYPKTGAVLILFQSQDI